jgi:hypothetical protein
MSLDAFLKHFDALPNGYGEGVYQNRRYGVTKTVKSNGRQAWLYAEELGGNDAISFNLYRLSMGAKLKPCEMPETTVIAFVLGYVANPV